MKEFFKKIKVLDILFFAIVLSLIIIASIFIYSSSSSKLYLVVKTPEGEWIYPMEKDISFSVKGEIGITNIKIEDKTAMVVSSPCSNKTCVFSMGIKNHGDWNACLPNKVFLSIEER